MFSCVAGMEYLWALHWIQFKYLIKKFSITNKSKFVDIKHSIASLGEQTIGSPLTLKLVFINKGHFVKSLNFCEILIF